MQESDTAGESADDETTAHPATFATQVADLVVGRRVRVESIGGHRFEGRLESVCLDDRHVVLRDVQELPGGIRAPSAFVAGVDWIVPVDDDPPNE